MRTISRTGAPARRMAVVVALATSPFALCATTGGAFGQSVQRPPEQADPKAAEAEAVKKKEAARRAFEAGSKAYEAGKMDAAVKSLGGALETGGLASPEMAKALYYRGLAYRKQGKLPQAISDLTSAIWIKNGLPDKERAEAMEARAAAYRDAGVNQGDANQAGEPPLPWTSAEQPASRPANAPPSSSSLSSSAWQTATTDAAAPAAPAPSLAPAETKPQASDSGSGLGGFFSNLFGGSSSSAKPPPAEAPPPPTPPAEAPPPQSPASAAEPAWTATAEPATSSWSEQTTVADAPAKKVAAVEPPREPARPPAANGKFRLQIATVRTREDADALAKRLRSEHEGRLGSAALAVDETVLGNMGTFYRVQLGPYRTAEESEKVCATLKASGYDCLVVTR